MVTRLVHPDFQHATHLDFFFQQWVVVLLEQAQEFFRISPLGFVVVLDGERLASCGGCVLRLGQCGNYTEQYQQKGESLHVSFPFRCQCSRKRSTIVVHCQTLRQATSRVCTEGLLCLADSVLPVRPDEPEDGDGQDGSNYRVELVEVLAQGTPVLSQLHSEPSQGEAPRPGP